MYRSAKLGRRSAMANNELGVNQQDVNEFLNNQSAIDKARTAKCRKIHQFLIEELIKMMNKPENAVMWEDAARGAGTRNPSLESQALICQMLRDGYSK
jgi:hypothetical protein